MCEIPAFLSPRKKFPISAAILAVCKNRFWRSPDRWTLVFSCMGFQPPARSELRSRIFDIGSAATGFEIVESVDLSRHFQFVAVNRIMPTFDVD